MMILALLSSYKTERLDYLALRVELQQKGNGVERARRSLELPEDDASGGCPRCNFKFERRKSPLKR